jgi:hypothetical protein
VVGGAPFSNHSARRFTIFGSSGLKKKRTNFKQCRGSGSGAFLSSIRDQGWIITINVTVVFMARYVMILNNATSLRFTRGIGRGGP